MASESVELIVLLTIFGMLGILAMYAYDGATRAFAAIMDIFTLSEQFNILSTRFDFLYGRFDKLKAMLTQLAEKLGYAGEEIKNILASIFSIFGIIRNILGPVCSVTKVANVGGIAGTVTGGATSIVTGGLSKLGGIF